METFLGLVAVGVGIVLLILLLRHMDDGRLTRPVGAAF